jgi:hypothetical protein
MVLTFGVVSQKAARAFFSVLSFTVSMLDAQVYCAVTLVIGPRKHRDKVTTETSHGTTRDRHDATHVPTQSKFPLRHDTGIGRRCSNGQRMDGGVFRIAI